AVRWRSAGASWLAHREAARDQFLKMSDVPIRCGRVDGARRGACHPTPKIGGREEEDQAADQAEMGEHRIDWPEDALANPALDDLLHHREGAHRVDQDLLVQMRPARDDLAEHHSRQVRAVVRRVAHEGDELTQNLVRRTWVGPQRLDPAQELFERIAENRPVELELAAEVIADEGLVSAGLT